MSDHAVTTRRLSGRDRECGAATLSAGQCARSAEVFYGKNGMQVEAGFAKQLSTALFPVHECENSHDDRAMANHHLYGFEQAAPGCHCIVNDHDLRTGRKTTLDLPSGTVALRLFSHCERVERATRPSRVTGDGVGDRIGAEGHSPNEVGRPPSCLNGMPTDLTDEYLALPTHGCEAGVDVVTRTATAGECKIT